MKFYFLLSRKSLVAVIFTITLVLLLYGKFKSATYLQNQDGADNSGRVNYILSLGYKVDETPVSVKETVLPHSCLDVFEEYILMQSNANFPFEQFKGENVTVYDYADNDSNQITLIVSKGQIIGGHILDKVSHEMKPLENKE